MMREKLHELPAEVVFSVTQPKCRNARVVTREFEFPKIEPMYGDFKAGRDLPWVWYDVESDRLMARALVWDGWGPRVTVGAGVLEDVLNLAETFRQACETGNAEGFEQSLVEFCSTCGPLGITPGKEERPPLDLTLFRIYFAFFRQLMKIHLSTFVMREGQPPLVGIGAQVIEQQERLWDLQEWRRLEDSLPEILRSAAWAEGAPLHNILLNVFRNTKMPADFSTREKQIEWMREQVVEPVAGQFLVDDLASIVDFTPSGELRIRTHPRTLYGLGVLSLLALNQLRGQRECACGCGELAPPGRKYVDEKHRRRGQAKQNVLARYRTRKNRGQISEEQYVEVSQVLARLQAEGVRDKEEMVRQIELMLDRWET